MTVKLSASSILAFVAGIAALVLVLSGRDLSPSKSVADSPHSVVNMAASSESAWQANRTSLRSPGPDQVTVVEPVVVTVTEAPASDTPAPSFSGDTGLRTPNPELVAAAQEEAKPASEKAKSKADTSPVTESSDTVNASRFAMVQDASVTTDAHRFAMAQEDGSVFDPAAYAPCASDDGSGPRPCFYDAQARGNGIGTSFFVAANGNVLKLG